MNITFAAFALVTQLLMLGDAPKYADLITELEIAIDNYAHDDRQASIIQIEGLLEKITHYPDHTSDDNLVNDTVLRGQLVLVRLYLAEEDSTSAATIMDDVIKAARDQALPVRAYGPQVFRLYQARAKAIESAGRGTIAVKCAPPPGCDIVINARRLPDDEYSEELPLGYYQVWVKASDVEAPWHSYWVDLDTAKATETIEFAEHTGDEQEEPLAPSAVTPASPTPDSEAVPTGSTSADSEAVPTGSTSGVKTGAVLYRATPRHGISPELSDGVPPRRMLPRAAEISGAAVGVGLLVVGAVMLSYDGQCERSKERPTSATTVAECGEVYESTLSGAALLATGGGLLVLSGVMLSIDEVRVGRASGRQVVLGASLRF